MIRTTVHLSSEDLELLDRASRTSGASRSELIRHAIHTTFGQANESDLLLALQASAGSWKDRGQSGSEYVDALRGGDVNERLTRG